MVFDEGHYGPAHAGRGWANSNGGLLNGETDWDPDILQSGHEYHCFLAMRDLDTDRRRCVCCFTSPLQTAAFVATQGVTPERLRV